MINNADRKAFIADKVAKDNADKVAAWLKANPKVGVLNGGNYWCYYIVDGGMMIPVAEFSYIA